MLSFEPFDDDLFSHKRGELADVLFRRVERAHRAHDTLTEIVGVIVSLGPRAVKEFLNLESILNLGSDEKQNITNAILASDKADDDTIAHARAWLALNDRLRRLQ